MEVFQNSLEAKIPQLIAYSKIYDPISLFLAMFIFFERVGWLFL